MNEFLIDIERVAYLWLLEIKEQSKKGTTNLTLEIMNLSMNKTRKGTFNEPLKQVSTLKVMQCQKLCNDFNFFVSNDFKLTRIGASSVRKGTLGSLPSGLLTPTVP